MSPHYHASQKFPKDKLISLFLSLSPAERDKKFIPVSGVANLLGLHQRTIIQWIDEDKIAAITVGMRKKKIFLPSLEEFLQEVQKEIPEERED